MPFYEVQKIPLSQFLLGLRESLILQYEQTNPDYLEDCWLLEQTKPDKEGLRNLFGK